MSRPKFTVPGISWQDNVLSIAMTEHTGAAFARAEVFGDELADAINAVFVAGDNGEVRVGDSPFYLSGNDVVTIRFALLLDYDVARFTDWPTLRRLRAFVLEPLNRPGCIPQPQGE